MNEGGAAGVATPTGQGHDDERGGGDDRAAALHAQPPAALVAAIEYAGRGWPVLPVRDKRPLTVHGVHDATTDRDLIVALWRRWLTADVAIATGDVLVLDVDPRHGGDETLARLERQLGTLPETPTAATAGGGEHRYFRGVAGPLRATLGTGIDVQSHGKYVVAPPSRGGRYAWRTECAPEEIALAELPGAWLTALRRATAPAVTSVPARVVGHAPVADRVRRARAYVARMPAAVAGQGGHRALWLATLAVVRGFALEPEHALPILAEYSARCLPPWSPPEIAHKVADAMRADAPLGWLLGREVHRVA